MSTMINMVRSLAAVAALAIATPALAAGAKVEIDYQNWSFAGPFGYYDRGQLQRGFKVFQENCSACHALSRVAFRNLAEDGGPGFTEDQAKVIAADYIVEDGPDDFGDMFERPAILADRFPSPFPNEQAARASNNGAYPPDFSLLAKARAPQRGFPNFVFDIFTQYQENGPDYIYSLLTGYEEPPEGMEVPDGQYYNHSFLAGQFISMAPPLYEDSIEYTDGTPMTVENYARDVAAFMMWAAEPHLEDRKKIGFRVMIFLIVFAGMLYFTKKKLWRNVEH
ncbi:cytochrome c1 [Roseibium denhamense]|uniref:Cytochrome c1 n=1 Tax=Roseibium denhamense TaxID=76305 RepID=A0ABY1NGA0_9HYPH|nr:cytochrome c1 [Roseibium denhamense]MTI06332.1 cytochrome c1 [Roseibium denhamense]SMP08284.1 Cytochrome c1 [Roseibium denhamense]